MSRTTAHALGQSPAFRSLDEAELDRLASACSTRVYESREIVFLRGESGDCMYVVAEGSVAVSLTAVSGRDVLLAVLAAPHHFGELALVDDGPRVATVTARTRTVLVVLPRQVVAQVLARRPSVATALLVSMAGLVRRLDEQACDAALLDLPHRVEKHLASLVSHRPGEVPPDGLVPVEMALTQGDLARQIGGSRQQVNRVLMGLEADGSIERMGHRIVAVRPDRLHSAD